MLKKLLALGAVIAAGLMLATPSSAQESCKTAFQDYGQPLGEVACVCEAGRPQGIVYGDLTYTGDSDICTAAQHAGLIGAEGGTVTAVGVPGCQSYPSATKAGISSYSWGAWDIAFYFPLISDGICSDGATIDAQTPPAPAPMPAPTGDAMDMFLGMMTAGAPPGAFTYQNATKLGPNSFELTGIVLAPEGPGSEVSIEKWTVDNIDMAGMMQGGAPSTLTMSVVGLTLTAAQLDGDIRDVLGAETLTLNIALDYAIDAVTQDFALRDLTVEAPGLARISAAMEFLGVGMDDLMGMSMMGPEMMMSDQEAAMKSFSLTFDDQTLFNKALAAAMKEQAGMSEADLMNEALQSMANEVAGMGAAKGGPLWSVAEAIAGVIVNHAAPKGPLVISALPASPVLLSQISQTAGPDEAATLIGLVASYAAPATLPEPVASAPESNTYVVSSKDIYATGEAVDIYYGGLPGNANDWVSVVPAGTPDDQYDNNWTYTNGQTDGVFSVTGLADGNYEARVYIAGAYVVDQRYAFTVGGAQPTGFTYADPSKTLYAAGEVVTIAYDGLPGNAQDWISVVPAGTADDQFVNGQWSYTNGQTSGTYDVPGLRAGDYEVRVYFDYPNGGYTVQYRSYFTVQ